MAFRINQKQISAAIGRIVQAGIPAAALLRKEARWTAGFAQSSAGNLNQVSQGTVGAQDWMTRAPATIEANKAVPAAAIRVPAGRMYVITDISAFLTGNCVVHFTLSRYLNNTLGGITGVISLDGMLDGKIKVITSTDGGSADWKFDTPLVLMPGDELLMYYYRNSTVGLNWVANFGGMDLTFDTNYGAEKTIIVLGDSIPTTIDPGALSSDLFPVIIRDRFLAAGHNVRLINICQPGTTSNQWDWWIKQGRIAAMKADMFITNLGMNDLSLATNITNGVTRNAHKNIVREIRKYNPKSPIIVNSVSPSDTGSAIANGAGVRAEIAAAVGEVHAAIAPVILADTSTAYTTADGTNFVIADQAAGARVHANSAGHLKLADIIWTVSQGLLGLPS